MPRKDREAKLAYQREWYARPGNRERVIAKVTARKYNEYAGVCCVCGGPTVGLNGPGSASRYCGKPICKSVQRKRLYIENPGIFGTHKPPRTKPTPTLRQLIEESE